MSTATTKMKTRRAEHRGVLTKLLKKVEPSSEELLQEYDVSELSTIRGLIVKKQETIDQLNEKIVKELSEEEVSEEIEEANRYTYDTEMAVTKLSKIIKESEITDKQSMKKDLSTTPIRIVYDCSCRQDSESPSLNDCLSSTPPQLNKLTDILTRFRYRKYALITDIEKAFLQIGLDEEDRDSTRFFCLRDPSNPKSELETYRFKVIYSERHVR
ncbi:Hypothetical predicted protein [Mytilus galloprovincialis]|uniref:Reverse transcriptase domain-containing protein n=1 Tax=Mytilus galloprovincialis TaxID=29158 RepID=A0A8B6G4B6_MYTGA|nr:Hypothetical predicted protein [Mytilus galloprovincialis]